MHHSKVGDFIIGFLGAAAIVAAVIALIATPMFPPDLIGVVVVGAIVAILVLAFAAAISAERPFIVWGAGTMLILSTVIPLVVISACARAFRF